MAKSNFTEKIKRKYWTLKVMNFILLIAPLLFYIGLALASGGTVVYAKIAVVASVMIAGILTTYNIIAKLHLRAPIWIILLGLFIAIKQYLLPLVIILAITSILDDLIFSPIISRLRVKLIASKTMDEREDDRG